MSRLTWHIVQINVASQPIGVDCSCMPISLASMEGRQSLSCSCILKYKLNRWFAHWPSVVFSFDITHRLLRSGELAAGGSASRPAPQPTITGRSYRKPPIFCIFALQKKSNTACYRNTMSTAIWQLRQLRSCTQPPGPLFASACQQSLLFRPHSS